MRDLAVTAIVFGSVPFILWRPYIGVLMWTWLAFMNPHRLTWGFAYSMQFALVIALATLVALLVSRDEKKIPWTRETVVLALFTCWMVLTTVFATYAGPAWMQMEKVAKIQLMVFVTMILMSDKDRISLLVWLMTLSLAFYGIKGGVFTIVNGGVHHVRGPAGSFIGGNNEIALALIMTIPLLRYLSLSASRAWLRHAMTVAMILTVLAAVGSHSRGAFVGLAAMGTFLWLKSRSKLVTAVLAVISIWLVVSVMPQSWFDRMQSIQRYEQDGSALGRINAWQMAFNLAKDKPLGGGFEAFKGEMFARYAPEPTRVHDAHSIYFEVLGEHGFIGLGLYLLLGLMTWRTASWIIRHARGHPQHRWAADLAAMIQVSMIGYASAGAFLGLAYFDFYYTLVAVVVLCRVHLTKQGVGLKQELIAFGQPATARAS